MIVSCVVEGGTNHGNVDTFFSHYNTLNPFDTETHF
ncbi:hypothetical protein E2C01_056587 [Portunus trituberculatus]|uniref:Uncharacterized protein n=1 Tax=Portunus trituberculatus TaxID=210409 RepID=A0A5B7GUJ7_PORTR|nr:hypothetical protein [Portunus trituberculatus]